MPCRLTCCVSRDAVCTVGGSEGAAAVVGQAGTAGVVEGEVVASQGVLEIRIHEMVKTVLLNCNGA